MRKKHLFAAAIAVLLAAAGLVLASNVGFKISYELLGPADSIDGTNWVGLPYHNKPGLDTASDLFDDLGGAAVVTSVARFDPATEAYEEYTGGPDNDFTLIPGDGVRVIMQTTVTYEIYGSHDPAQVVTLLGPEDSAQGQSYVSLPYHSDATTAGELMDELGADNIESIGRYMRSTGTTEVYLGTSGDFTLQKGEAYKIKVLRTMQFVPKTRY